jgi:transcriptional regulator with XRE-family HTH domain
MIDHLPDLVRKWRSANCLSQAAAAERLGVSQPTLSRIEGGGIPDRENARRFVDAGVFTAEQLGRAIVSPEADAA